MSTFAFTEEQLSAFREQKPPFGIIGAPTYMRTYSRPVYNEEGKVTKKEEFLDTVKRVIEGNVNLGIENGDPTATKEWALDALEYMYKFGVMPPGRGYWMMGTEYAEQRGGDALNNCFRAGTLVHTENGVVPIEDLVGKSVKVLSQDGKYRLAEFKSYGEQPLMKVSFSNGDEVFATPEHQWVIWDEKKKEIRKTRVFTKDLSIKSHKIPLVFPNTEDLIPDEEGIAHGFVYGDGTINSYKTKTEGTKSYGLVRFPNQTKKDAMFDLISKYGTSKGEWQVPAIIHLPVAWKAVPDVNSITKEYALGFIIGLITADGYVRESTSIHQSNREELEKIRRLAMWAGLKTTPIRIDSEVSPFTGEYSPMYVFTISNATLKKDWLVRQDQKDKWKCKKGKVQKTVSIRSVEETDLVEEVYCCTEMETHTMTIESGILTGQCWYVAVRPQSYEDIEMFKEQPYIFSDPWKEVPSYPFVFMFDRAMLGGGVGFGVNRRNLELIPKVQAEVHLKIFLHSNHPDWQRIKESEEWERIQDYVISDRELVDANKPYYFATDDREGWNICVRETIDGHFSAVKEGHKNELVIDLSRIRPYGATIKGFGGTASGPLPLMSALVEINNILNSRVGENITSADALDIMNLLGRCVVAGNVRRTALIALGDADDYDYVEAKNYKHVLPIMEKDENGYTIWEKNKWGRLTQKRRRFGEVVKDIVDRIVDEIVEDTGVSPSHDYVVNTILPQAEEEANELFELSWKQENHRWASNNSVYTYEMFEDHHFIAAGIIANGEPGVGNEWLMKNFGRIMDGFQEAIDKDAEGLNPCAEITLWNCEPCNLVEVVPYNIEKFGLSMERALEIATQYAYRITFAKYMWKQTARVIAQNRRIGVSLTGMQDYFLSKYGHYAVKGFEVDPETGEEDITKPIFHQEILDELDSWYKIVKKTNKEHAKLMGSNESIKVTTVKPSGTVAKLPGVSSGIHWHYAPYMIQRIRFHETDPNLDVLRACGLHIEKAAKEPNTMVVEFPIKNANAEHPNFLSAGDVPLEVQFANQYLFAYAWADNAVSATLTFKSEETDKIEPLLKSYNNRIKSTSLLPYSGHGYVQAPWEPITKEKYEEMVSKMVSRPEDIYHLFDLTVEPDEELLDSDCASGACPAK